MKQQNIKFLYALLISLLSVNASAHDIEVANADGVTIYYEYNYKKTELAVSYRGSSFDSYYNEYSGNVVIPESVTYDGKTYSVTSIGSAAFWECTGLTSVTIPNSVTSIGNYVFYACRGLESVYIFDLAAWCNISFSSDDSNPFCYAHHLFLNGEEI